MTEAEEEAAGLAVAEFFYLRTDAGYKPKRWKTAGGNKTALGLCRTFLTIAKNIRETGNL